MREPGQPAERCYPGVKADLRVCFGVVAAGFVVFTVVRDLSGHPQRQASSREGGDAARQPIFRLLSTFVYHLLFRFRSRVRFGCRLLRLAVLGRLVEEPADVVDF